MSNVYHVGQSTPSNGGKWELMHYIHLVTSYLPPLGGVGLSDIIDIGFVIPVKILVANSILESVTRTNQ